jgi:L-seryl-tRNA(Ser) seleniumtransferase
MEIPNTTSRLHLPSVDRLLRHGGADMLITHYGRGAVTEAVRVVLAQLRASRVADNASGNIADDAILGRAGAHLQEMSAPSLRRVFNLTGTVLHTNLGRAPLPDNAIAALTAAAREPSNIEFDLGRGVRGDRDDHVEWQLCRLTGAEAATVVNNNAAAVLLVLNSLALRKEVPASRGELVEIGGSFRIPDIMARSGCRLVEVGTTNRTHLRDYAQAVGAKTGLVMKVHTSNYSIEGFTASVPEAELAKLCHERSVPFVVDLGSGALVDFREFGLPYESTAMQALADGADVVTFSGDKLLGGPQAGIIVGRADLVAKIKRNPLKRALRVDKMTIAALSAVLSLYFNPEHLAAVLPILRVLTRPVFDIAALAERLRPVLAAQLGPAATVEVIECESQIGSGALPTQRIPSAGLAVIPARQGRGSGTALNRLSAVLRTLPIPVIGRNQNGRLILDLRCLEDEAGFAAQLPQLAQSIMPDR